MVQIGKKEDTGVVDKDGNLTADAKETKEILEQYVRSFQERNPNLYLFNAVLHRDEATPHLHLDYIPVAHGYKTKMHTRNSLTKALQEMGIAPATSKLDNETMHWQQRERAFLEELCRGRGIEIEIIGEKRDNYTIPEYKAARQKADELTAELEILNAEKKESEAEIVLINTQVSSSRDEIANNEHRLEEIKSEISKREKKYKECEARIDTVLEAEKPVKKKLEAIQNNTKQLPAILNKEPHVSLPKKDYDHLVKMAWSSGILKKLNETYDKRITKLQEKINTLTEQVNMLTDKLLKAEAFMKVKGFLEEFKAYMQPKSIKSLLFTKKRQAEEQNKSREQDRDRNRTRNGMAI